MRSVLSWAVPGLFVLAACAHGPKTRPRASVCRDFEQDVEEVWSSKRRARIEGKAAALEVGSSRTVVRRVSTQMDTFQRSWVLMKESSCGDCLIRDILPKLGYNRISTCLDTVLARQRNLAIVLEAGDPARLVYADAMMATLTHELQGCREAAVMAAFDHGRDAAGGGERDEVEVHALRVSLADAESQLDLADADAALRGATAAIETAQRLGLPRLEAQARRLRARAMVWLSRNAEGLAETYRGEPLVRSGTDASLLIKILITRSSALSRLGRAFEAVESARDAERRAAAKFADTDLHAEALANLGAALDEVPGRDDTEVLAAYTRAQTIYAKLYGPESLEVADLVGRAGIAHGRSGRATEAVASFEQQRELLGARLGTEHPRLSDPLINLGVALIQLGRRAEALAALERGYELRRSSFGEAHLATANALLNLGQYHRAGGDHAAAFDLFERAHASAHAVDPASPEAASAGFAAAESLRHLGRPEQAEPWYERLRLIHHDRADFGRECFALEGLAGAANERGQVAVAITRLEHAVRVRELITGETPELGFALGQLGELQAAVNDGRAALASLTRARTIFAKHDLPGLAPYRDAVDGRLRAVCAANPRLECRP